jgi:hypothetical protein
MGDPALQDEFEVLKKMLHFTVKNSRHDMH